MNIWQIAFRSIQQRWLPSALTAFSMALGVTLVVAVLTIHGVVSDQFRNNEKLGYNLIIGAKGSPLQLTLNSVYYLSQPVENIDYRFFLEFVPAKKREPAMKNSYAAHMHDTAWDTLELANASLPSLCGDLYSPVATDIAENLAKRDLDLTRGGKYSAYSEFAIPLCMGDFYGAFRVVGTTSELFDLLPKFGRQYKFASGRNIQDWSKENGFFEAVVGAAVAREMDVKLGSEIYPAHGGPSGHRHENGFKVVGILRSSGTPADRAVFVNMEGFFLMSDHSKPVLPTEEETEITAELGKPEGSADEAGHEPEIINAAEQLLLEPLPLENRQVTSFLLRTDFLAGPRLPKLINQGPDGQAVAPLSQITQLMMLFVRPVQQIMLLLTILIVFVSGVSILVSIYNSMSERRHEIAVMRSLGANRTTVMMIILAESIMLACGGGLMGMVLGHGLNAAAAPIVEQQTGVEIGFFDFAPAVHPFELVGLAAPKDGWKIPPELLLIPFLMGLAMLVGLLPAMAAYRTDVADSLGK